MFVGIFLFIAHVFKCVPGVLAPFHSTVTPLVPGLGFRLRSVGGDRAGEEEGWKIRGGGVEKDCKPDIKRFGKWNEKSPAVLVFTYV